MEEAQVTKEQFHANLIGEPKVINDWFKKLELPLLPREVGCLDFFCA